MIRIVFPETTTLPAGGYQYSTFDIIGHLANSDGAVESYYAAHESTSVYAAALRQNLPARIISLGPDGFPGWRRPLWGLTYMWRAWRFLCRERIDIVHSSNETLLFWLIPCFLTGAVPIWNVRAEMPDDWRGWLRQRVHFLFCRNVIFVSRAAQASIERLGFPAKTHTALIRNLVPRRFVERPETRRNPPGFDTPPEEICISFVGRVDDPNKRADWALEIALRTLEQFPQGVSFHFWGRLSEPAKAAFARRIPGRFAGRIHFHGIIADCGEIYRQTDILLLTSLSEGSPRVIMEAGACGIPALATPAGGVPELIVDGRTGLLFDSVECGVEQLLPLIRDPNRRVEMGRAAREHFLQHFHYDGIIPQYLEFYAECLRRRRPATLESGSGRETGAPRQAA